MAIWTSKTTVTPQDTSSEQMRLLMLLTADWLNNDRTHSVEIAGLLAGLVATLGPPTVVDVPYVSRTDDVLSCTKGNWDGEPTSYTYAWHSDGVANGATGAEYTVVEADAGHTVACVVTATNALGSTTAPMSNSVAIEAVP